MNRILSATFALLALPFVLHAAEPEWSLRPGTDGVTLVSPAGREVLGYLKTKPAGSALTANSACGIYPLLTPAGESVVALAPRITRIIAAFSLRGMKWTARRRRTSGAGERTRRRRDAAS